MGAGFAVATQQVCRFLIVCSVCPAMLEFPQPESQQLHLHPAFHQAVGRPQVAMGPQGAPMEEQQALKTENESTD